MTWRDWLQAMGFRPLDVRLVLKDRPYRLGEAISLTVEVQAKREVEVREGRMDLVCEEVYPEVYALKVPAYRRRVLGSSIIDTPLPAPMISEQVTEARVMRYVHSSGVFLTNERLRSGVSKRYSMTLEIQPERPPHADIARLTWELVATLDVGQGGQVTKKWRTDVLLS